MNPLLRFAGLVARLLPAPLKQGLYKVKPLAALLRRSLNTAAPHGLTEVKVAAGALAGFTLTLDLQTEKDYWLGTYETNLQLAARQFIQPAMVVYDVGANIGYISLLFASLCGKGGSVHSFEALPANINRFTRNITLNKMQDRIHLNACAVVDSSRPVKFLTHTSGAMGKVLGSAGREESYQNEIQVQGLALDDYVFKKKNPPPQLIKMDIEGGEVLAIKGMQRILKEIHPLFFIELHGEQSAAAVWQTLTSSKYVISTMQADFKPVSALDQLSWKAYIIARPGN